MLLSAHSAAQRRLTRRVELRDPRARPRRRLHRLLGVRGDREVALPDARAGQERLHPGSAQSRRRRVAALWDPAKDEASGEACRSYGAAALLQVPGRLHITWQDDNTLRVDTDSGTQTRLFRFAPPQGQGAPSESRGSASPPANEKPSWQGYSVAEWGGDEPRDRRDGQGGPVQDKEGRLVVDRAQRRSPDFLKVVTTRMRPGYLQKNGVPYSANAIVEEYFDVFSDPYTKNTWLAVTTMVTDPQYLIEPLIMHAHFKKLPDASGWDPTPCRANEPR
jgi:hypothetical protein